MKYVDEFRDGETCQKLAREIKNISSKAWTIMEICGGQTHSIMKYGLDTLLPEGINLIHGPGCPVCVTSTEKIELALQIAAQSNVIFCSFGDMLRVPGREKSLLQVKAEGADVRTVYSPMDALSLAKKHPDKQVVFFAVGFETTAPANAMTVYQAHQQQIKNFSLLVSHVLVPPAMQTILGAANNKVQGFLAAGHVCTIMGYQQYQPIAEQYQVPIVVTGFEPVDILQGLLMCIQQLESGRYQVENQYSRSVSSEGNKTAQSILQKVFTIVDHDWRGLDVIPQSGLSLREPYDAFDAEKRFSLTINTTVIDNGCIAGQILTGQKKPNDCAKFAKACNPEHPLGATMVSSEGACAAYYQYRQTV